MDPSLPPPNDQELPRVLAHLEAIARRGGPDDRRKAIEDLYAIAYKVGGKAAACVPLLIECLSDADAKTAEDALWGLRYCKPHSIEPLIDCLDHPDPSVRTRAASALGSIGDEAHSANISLRRLLKDPNPDVRCRAAWALGLIHDTGRQTIEELFKMAANGAVLDRRASLHALGNIGKFVTDLPSFKEHSTLVMSALDDPDDDVRWSALYVIESLSLPDQDHADLLLKVAIQDRSDRVSEAALTQLKHLVPNIDLTSHVALLCEWLNRSARSVTLVCEILSSIQPAPLQAIAPLVAALDVDERVLPVAEALWKIDRRVVESLPALARIFDDYDESVCDVLCVLGPAAAPLLPKLIEALETENWDLQWAAADAIGAIASADPVVLKTLQVALGHESPIVRSAAARALARVGSSAIPSLIDILQLQDDTRCSWAAFALGEMGPAAFTAAPQLRIGMGSSHQVLSSASAIALARIAGDPQAVPYLIQILESEDPASPRRAAAAALGDIGLAATEAIGALELVLDDDDPEVGAAAREALEAIVAKAH